MGFTEIHLDHPNIRGLELWLRSLDEVTSFFEDAHRASLVTCYTMSRELGGPNDNLALHLFDRKSGEKISRAYLNGKIIDSNGRLGLLVSSSSCSQIDIRVPGFGQFIETIDGGFIIFPELIARCVQAEGIEPVLVKTWLLQTTFSSIDPKTSLYKDEMWELAENDAFTYAKLISKKQMVLQGLHDIVDHAASARSSGWNCAADIATEMSKAFSKYFYPETKGNIASHLIPFAAGVILDELTQMPHYGSEGRITAIRLLISRLSSIGLEPLAPLALRDFPVSIDSVTAAARAPYDLELIKNSVEHYTSDVQRLTYSLI